MVDGVLTLMPNAKIGHIGLYRNEETLEPVEYYCKLPKHIENKTVIIILLTLLSLLSLLFLNT